MPNRDFNKVAIICSNSYENEGYLKMTSQISRIG